MAKISPQKYSISWPFWGLCAFLVLVFASGGGARADIHSLMVLRPVAAMLCAFGVWRLSRGHIQQYRFLFIFAALLFGLIGLQLIPLPPAFWGALPGREIVTEIDRVAGLGNVWRPISMVPSGTWNALFSLLIPLAVLLLGVQLTRDQRFQLLPVLLILGLSSGAIGLLQVTSAADSPLYFYEITNNGWAVSVLYQPPDAMTHFMVSESEIV